MKHEIAFTAPFIATIDDETPLGKRALALLTLDPEYFYTAVAASTLIDPKFDEYMAYVNKRNDDTPHEVFVALDKATLV